MLEIVAILGPWEYRGSEEAAGGDRTGCRPVGSHVAAAAQAMGFDKAEAPDEVPSGLRNNRRLKNRRIRQGLVSEWQLQVSTAPAHVQPGKYSITTCAAQAKSNRQSVGNDERAKSQGCGLRIKGVVRVLGEWAADDEGAMWMGGCEG